MLQDSFGLMTVPSLPEPPLGLAVVRIVYLSVQDKDFPPGLYIGSAGSWSAVGSGDGSQVTLRTITVSSDEYPLINLSDHIGESMLLSTVVRKQGDDLKTLTVMEGSTPLEVVQLTKQDTAIAIPVPYASHSINASPGLEIVFKVL